MGKGKVKQQPDKKRENGGAGQRIRLTNRVPNFDTAQADWLKKSNIFRYFIRQRGMQRIRRYLVHCWSYAKILCDFCHFEGQPPLLNRCELRLGKLTSADPRSVLNELIDHWPTLSMATKNRIHQLAYLKTLASRLTHRASVAGSTQDSPKTRQTIEALIDATPIESYY